jgi:23S rRNA (cytidine1920-2'-O)/16S rRNA (cytidine1409-2'-O)-methyltransferase
MKNKHRLDKLLLEQKIFNNLPQAQSAIMQGKVFVNDLKISKSGTIIDSSSHITIKHKETDYVSRGGKKLKGALKILKINPEGKIAADIGSSTGGFTDCLLNKGCSLVFAIDVGYGDLDMKIRQDQRVIPIERTNARHLTWSVFDRLARKSIKNELKQQKKLPISEPQKLDLVVMDVSFISILKILPAIKKLIKPEAEIVSLVKPQFEANKDEVPKGGIISDSKLHQKIVKKVIKESEELGFTLINKCDSPIKGTQGNKEFFIYLKLK